MEGHHSEYNTILFHVPQSAQYATDLPEDHAKIVEEDKEDDTNDTPKQTQATVTEMKQTAEEKCFLMWLKCN